MRARLLLALLALAGQAAGLLRGSAQADAHSVQATKAIAAQSTRHTPRRPESLASKMVTFPEKQKASDPYQVGNITFSKDLGPQTPEPDAGVGLKPLFIIFVAAIFFALLVGVCVILPPAEPSHVTSRGVQQTGYTRSSKPCDSIFPSIQEAAIR
ncbi:unnamed protein product [Symbiodinium natans]|uniref:Uncharacterized protein n=1 Tax=Symbiodinium natans TaxID=878477 RepID=A0A812JNX1_9DINO|nr:unnamed protein product [Symbiodinium natans]